MSLYALMESGRLPPLAYFFARFVARGCGAPEDSPVALAAALVSARNLGGDVCVELASFAGKALFEDEEAASESEAASSTLIAPGLDAWLEGLRSCDWVGTPGAAAALVLDGERLYLGKYWHFEHRVAEALRARLVPAADLDRELLADGLERLFAPDATIAGPDWQRIAAAVAVSRRFAVISGGPGTGKTTTVVKVLALLLEQEPELRIALAAPTGKAAARLTESVGAGKQRIGESGALAEDDIRRIPEQAQTIHRLLGYGADGQFRRGRDNPLPVDCLVVDEASMIDLPLMARLLDALQPAARLILLGDRDQLASVEAGNVLGDITGRGRRIGYDAAQIRLLAEMGAASEATLREALPEQDARVDAAGADLSPADAVALLRHSWRFGADSGIGALSRAVNAGNGELALALLDDQVHQDVARLAPVPEGLHPHCIDWALERYARVLDAQTPDAALKQLEGVRVLCALHRGPFGVEALNARITEQLLSAGKSRRLPGEDALHHGMPVMITANDYEVGLFNGDVGLLWLEEGGDGFRARACFRSPDGGLRTLTLRQLPPYVCAYALTVHKSQGSEFGQVLLVLPPQPHPLATRELLYTAVTRARTHVLVHAGGAAIEQACAERVRRTSALAERLGWPAAERG